MSTDIPGSWMSIDVGAIFGRSGRYGVPVGNDFDTRSGYAARVPAAERREAILDAALAAFSEGGVAAVTMEDLARRTAVSKPVIYRHFSNTEEVLRELLHREAAAAAATAIAQLPSDANYTDPMTATPAALMGLLDDVRANPARWQLIVNTQAWTDSETRELVDETRSFVVLQLAHLADIAFAERAGGELDTELTAYLIWAGVEEAARLIISDPHRFPRERIVAFTNEVVRTFLQG